MSAICFNLDQSKILSSGNGKTRRRNVGLVQIEGVCKLHHKYDSEIDICGDEGM